MSKAAELAALIGSQTALSNRNLVINGAMQVAQRSTSVTGITGTGYNTIDRWKTELSGLGTWTQSQSTDVPSGQGFAYSLKMDCTTADASPAAGDYLYMTTILEGQDVQHLKKGTSSAESVTLSFWVKSSKTGTHIAEIYDLDNLRHISKAYTVSTADTWEHKSLTFPGDTVDAFGNDNGASLILNMWMGAGSDRTSGTLATAWQENDAADRGVGQVNLADNTANDWYITGVQLEVGEQATPFEHEPFSVTLQKAMRYYEKGYDYDTAPGTAAAYPGNLPFTVRGMDEETSGQRYMIFNLKSEKRATPTNTYYDEQGNTGKVTTYASDGTGTHNVSIGLVVTQRSKYGAGPGNSAIWGFGFFYECDAEL